MIKVILRQFNLAPEHMARVIGYSGHDYGVAYFNGDRSCHEVSFTLEEYRAMQKDLAQILGRAGQRWIADFDDVPAGTELEVSLAEQLDEAKQLLEVVTEDRNRLKAELDGITVDSQGNVTPAGALKAITEDRDRLQALLSGHPGPQVTQAEIEAATLSANADAAPAPELPPPAAEPAPEQPPPAGKPALTEADLPTDFRGLRAIAKQVAAERGTDLPSNPSKADLVAFILTPAA